MKFVLPHNFIPVLFISILVAAGFLVTAHTVHAATSTWNATDWTLYDTITIDHTQVDDDLTNFPVYVDLSDLSSQFWSTVSNGGGDIRVMSNDRATEMPREVVSASTTAETGELHFRANSISSTTDTTFRIYYNGSTTAAYARDDAYGSENVWSNDYVLVLHGSEDSDSTGSDFTVSRTGAVISAGGGQLGDGFSLDGTGDYIEINSPIFSGDKDPFSYQMWLELDTFSGNTQGQHALIGEYNDTDNDTRNYWNAEELDQKLVFDQFTPTKGSASTTGVVTAGVRYKLHVTKDSDTVRFYRDGNQIGGDISHTETYTGIVPTKTWIGERDANNSNDYAVDGMIDEVRVASTSRSAAWISAEYTNQSTTTDFYTTTSQAGAISGTFFAADRTTPYTGTATVTLAIATGTVSTKSTTTNDGSFSFTYDAFASDISTTTATLYIDDTAGVTAATVLGSLTNGYSDAALYRNHVIVRGDSDDTTDSITSTALAAYDNSNDTDLPFTATTSTASADTLTIEANHELYVWENTTFVPMGGVTINGSGLASSTDGSLTLAASSSYIGGADDLKIAGNFFTASTSRFFPHATGTVFTATTTGKIIGPYLSGYPERYGIDHMGAWRFTGAGGSWIISGDATTTDFYIATGTVYNRGDLTVGGDLTQNGTLDGQQANYKFSGLEGALLSSSTVLATTTVLQSTVDADYDIFIGKNGTKLYVGPAGLERIKEYDLSTPWDVSTATYVQENAIGARNFDFSPDGHNLYVNVNNTLYRYKLTTPWDISSTVEDGSNNFSDVSTPTLSADGSKLYAPRSGFNSVRQYELSIPWDISSSSLDTSTYVEHGVSGVDFGNFSFNRNGSVVYNHDGDAVVQVMQLSIPWDITTATLVDEYALTLDNYTRGNFLSDDSRYYYVVDSSLSSSDAAIQRIEMKLKPQTLSGTLTGDSALGDVTLSGSSSKTFLSNASTSDFTITAGSGTTTIPAGLDLSVGGDFTQNGVLDGAYANYAFAGVLRNYFATSSIIATTSVSQSVVDADYGIFIGKNGTKLYVGPAGTRRVAEYDLSTPWDVTSASFVREDFNFSSRFYYFSPDGRHFYTLDGGVRRYVLATPWDISTATEDRFYYLASASNLFFSPDGTKFYTTADQTNEFLTYELSIPWDMSTSSISSISEFDLVPTAYRKFTFSPHGDYLYIHTDNNLTDTKLKIFNLATAWDVTTAVEIGEYTPALNNFAEGITMSEDGRYLYLVEANSGSQPSIHRYEISLKPQTLSGTLTADSALGDVMLTGSSSKYFTDHASTTDLTIATSSGTTTAYVDLTIGGDFTNNSVFAGQYGRQFFTGGRTKIAGNLTGSSALGDVVFSNAVRKYFTNSAVAGDLSIANLGYVGDGTASSTVKISDSENGGPSLESSDYFGSAITNIGDLNGDGVADLAVGARSDESTSGPDAEGAIHILFMNTDGSAASTLKISDGENGGPSLDGNDFFGWSVAALGDLNGDGVPDLAVGAAGDEATAGGNAGEGAIHILFMNSDGSAASTVKISDGENGGPTGLDGFDSFGSAVTNIGDFNGDGISDLAVGANYDEATSGGDSSEGAVHILFMNSDGSAASTVKISDGENGGPSLEGGDLFGTSVATIGDLNGDGIPDLAVGASSDEATSGGDASEGAVHILFMNADGSAASSVKISDGENGGPSLDGSDYFGWAAETLGDLNGDGIADLAVGARLDEPASGFGEGALHILFLNADGSAASTVRISDSENGGPSLDGSDYFGSSITTISDLNSDGVIDLAVGAYADEATSAGDGAEGAVHILFLNRFATTSVYAPASLTLRGDYTNNGLVDFATNSGEMTFSDDAYGFDISSAVLATSSALGTTNALYGFTMSLDGRTAFVADRTLDDVRSFTLNSPWTFTDGITESNSYDFSGRGDPRGLAFGRGGTRMYVVDVNDDIDEHHLTTPYDITTATYFDTIDLTTYETDPTGLAFRPDGTQMFLVGTIDNAVDIYDLDPAWDASSASYVGTQVINTPADGPTGLSFSPNGLNMYVSDSGDTEVHQFTMSTPYDVDNATYLQSLSVNDLGPIGVFMKPDGRSLYYLGDSSKVLEEYTLDPAPQTATGTMTGTSAFYDLTIENTAGAGSSSQSVIFGAGASTTGTFSMVASTSAQFLAGATYDFSTLALSGTANSTPVWLQSSSEGTSYNFNITNLAEVNYVNVQDNDATLTSGGITAYNSTDDGGNTNWTFSTATSGPVWNSTDFTDRIAITIDSTKVDETLTDFPVYIDLSDINSNTLWNTVRSDCSDIRIMNSALTTEMAREVVACDTAAETGELHFKADTVSSSTDTVFYLYFNGTAADYASTTAYGSQAVWSNDFLAVYHDGGVTDSTSFNRTAAAQNSAAAGGVNGQVGQAADLNGDTHFFESTNAADIDALTSFTVSTWVRYDGPSTIDDDPIYTFESAGYDHGSDVYTGLRFDGYGASSGNDNTFKAAVNNGFTATSSETEVNDAVAGEYLLLHQTWISSSTATLLGVYRNGESTTLSTLPAAIGGTINADVVAIGRGIKNGYWNGVIDEFRIASTSRSDAWISAEYTNQSTTTDFYTLSYAPEVTLSDSDAGQASNVLDFRNKTNEPLFAFKLTPGGENSTTTEIVFTLGGVQGIETGELTNLELYRDLNSDGTYDAGEPQIGGSGSLSLSGQASTITFSTDWIATTTQNYILVGDTVGVDQNDRFTLALHSDGITATGLTSGDTTSVSGSLSKAEHLYAPISGGSFAGGGSGSIGGDAPVGDGDVGGGGAGGGSGAIDTNTGGDTIGSDPNFDLPTAQAGSWNSASNAYDGTDGTYATTASAVGNNFTDHSFGVPGSDTIEGIEVKLELSGTTAAGDIDITLSWDGGTTWTATKTTPTLTTTDAVVTIGSPSDTWGRAWTVSETNNSNFAIRLTGNPSSNEIRVDEIQVRIYHQASGGGSGGGSGSI